MSLRTIQQTLSKAASESSANGTTPEVKNSVAPAATPPRLKPSLSEMQAVTSLGELFDDSDFMSYLSEFLDHKSHSVLKGTAKSFADTQFEQEKLAREWEQLATKLIENLYELVNPIDEKTKNPIINAGLVRTREGKTIDGQPRTGFPTKEELDQALKRFANTQKTMEEDLQAQGLSNASIKIQVFKLMIETQLNLIMTPLFEYVCKQAKNLNLPDSNHSDLREIDPKSPIFIIIKLFKELNAAPEVIRDAIKPVNKEAFEKVKRIVSQFQENLNKNLIKWIDEFQRITSKQNLDVEFSEIKLAEQKILMLAQQGASLAQSLLPSNSFYPNLDFAENLMRKRRDLDLLAIAFYKRNRALVALLIKLGAPVTQDALSQAFQSGWEPEIDYLLRRSVIPDYKLHNLTLLINNLGLVKKIFNEKKPNPEDFPAWFDRVFRDAVEHNQADIFSFVADFITPCQLDNHTVFNALFNSIQTYTDSEAPSFPCRNPNILKTFLTKFGVNPERMNQFADDRAICSLSINDQIVLTKQEMNSLFGRFVYNNITPLMFAALNLSVPHVELLLQFNADPCIKDKKEQDALKYAESVFNLCEQKLKNLLGIGDPKNAPLIKALAKAGENFQAIKQMLLHAKALRLNPDKQTKEVPDSKNQATLPPQSAENGSRLNSMQRL